MLPNLTANESRIIGCLMEKSIYTPDQYPLTLNALTNACNQKSARYPVMSLNKGLVQHTARDLRDMLLLRGPQTPGEIKARSERLHVFADNTSVVDALNSLLEYSDPLIVKLPRTPGRKDSEYMHLFSGPIDVEAHAMQAMATTTAERASKSDLEQRVARLEAEIVELRALINT
jgi:uncharacterized protein YceH (UPF0502 family)